MTTTQARRPRVSLPAPSDLYCVDELLTDDERLIRDTVRSMVRERVLPVIGDHFEAGTFPRELVGEAANLGLLGMHLTGYGCAGTTAVAYTTSNLGTTHRAKAEQTALALAEAGLNDAYATLHNASNPTMSGATTWKFSASAGIIIYSSATRIHRPRHADHRQLCMRS